MIYAIRAAAILALCMVVAACANMKSSRAPGTDLSSLHTFYVHQLPADDNQIGKMISDELNTMGYKSTYGMGADPPGPVDAIVTYEDKWMWDMSMYLIRLSVQVREGESRTILASAEDYRPSLERKSPQDMVKEVVSELFKKDAK